MLNKKAQGMSMNIIVVAAIALIILVVLIVIFVGRTGKFAGSIEECKGSCVSSIDQCQGDYQRIDRLGKCLMSDGEPDPTNTHCCITVVPS